MIARTALVALALALLAAAPSSARTYHDTSTTLYFPPRSLSTIHINPRPLVLNGKYHWRVFSNHWSNPNAPDARARTVTLRGRYEWTDSLYVVTNRGTYRHESAFTNTFTGGTVIISYLVGGAEGNGSYHWGSTIDNVR